MKPSTAVTKTASAFRASNANRDHAGSLDEAPKAASTGLIEWLRQNYGLSLSDAAQVLGSGVRFSVPNLAGRSVGVAARIDKSLLAGISRPQ